MRKEHNKKRKEAKQPYEFSELINEYAKKLQQYDKDIQETLEAGETFTIAENKKTYDKKKALPALNIYKTKILKEAKFKVGGKSRKNKKGGKKTIKKNKRKINKRKTYKSKYLMI